MSEKTVSKKNIKKGVRFISQISKAAELGQCPFFYEWFLSSLESIYKIGDKNYKKMEYSLFIVIDPKFSKKQYSESFDVAYGTARNWLKDPKVVDAASTFAFDFVTAYIDEIKKIVFAPIGKTRLAEYVKKRDIALTHLFREAVFYRNHYLMTVLLQSINDMANLKDKKASNENTALFFAGVKFMQMVGAFYGVDDPDLIKKYSELIKVQNKAEFTALKIQIKFGDTQNAIEFVEVLEQQNSQLLDEISFLQTELSKARKKNGKK